MKLVYALLILLLLNLCTGLNKKPKESCQIYTEDEEGKGNSFLEVKAQDYTVESIEDSYDPNVNGSTGYFNDLESLESKKIDDIIVKDLGGKNISYSFDD
jgi:hypothetical protein